jgi:hypothetical protein
MGRGGGRETLGLISRQDLKKREERKGKIFFLFHDDLGYAKWTNESQVKVVP